MKRKVEDLHNWEKVKKLRQSESKMKLEEEEIKKLE